MIIQIGRIDDQELWVKLRHFQSEDLKSMCSALPGCRWESGSKSWRFSFSADMIRRLYGCFPEGQFVPAIGSGPFPCLCQPSDKRFALSCSRCFEIAHRRSQLLRPKKEKKLPYVLSEQEVLRVLKALNFEASYHAFFGLFLRIACK